MKKKAHRIYDCFCYFNEDMLLTLRLKTLWEHVDHFVIVESAYKHSGAYKGFNFSPDKFASYMSKIRYLQTNECPGGQDDPWINERAQRNELVKGLYDAKPLDRIMVSDLDEIPNPMVLDHYNPKYLRGDFLQGYYSYYLNNKLTAPEREKIWFGTKITLFEYFENFFKLKAESVRSYKSSGPLRSLKRSLFKWLNTHSIQNGGWHFTWMGSTDKIIEKISATAHQENNRPEYRAASYIDNRIRLGLDLVGSERRFEPVLVDETFPSEIIKNTHLYRSYLLTVPARSFEG